MKIFKVLLVVSLCGFAAGGFGAQVTDYVTEGNLESSYDIGCAGFDALSNKHSPADLYKGLAKCIEDGNHERGVLLFALAGVYGRFDTLRVADESAHQATAALLMTYIDSLEESKRVKFWEHLKASLSVPDELKRVCGEVRRIGAPDYFPRYMIQHGMGAILGGSSKDGLIGGFEPESVWEKSLDTYLHCPDV